MTRSRAAALALLVCACSEEEKPPVVSRGDGATPDASAADRPADAAAVTPDAAPLVFMVRLMPAAQDFGSVGIGSTAAGVVRVMNDSSEPLPGLAVALDPAGADFTLLTDGCGASLDPRRTCDVAVAFAPRSEGRKTAGLRVSAAGRSVTAMLSGMGVAASAVSLTPRMYNFGTVPGGVVGATDSFTLRNEGMMPTGDPALALAGTDADSFEMASHDCRAPLEPRRYCTIVIRFAPRSFGTKQASLRAFATPGGMAIAALSGFALEASLTVRPETHDFGPVATGSMAMVTLTVTNRTSLGAGVPKIEVDSALFSPFSVQNSSCDRPLAPAASCMLDIRFSPAVVRRETGAVTVSADPGGKVTIPLVGVGSRM